jgi:hypothetical protein
MCDSFLIVFINENFLPYFLKEKLTYRVVLLICCVLQTFALRTDLQKGRYKCCTICMLNGAAGIGCVLRLKMQKTASRDGG